MPDFVLEKLGGGTINTGGKGWKALVVYRGSHCPMCAMTLTALSEVADDYQSADIELIAVSADSAERALPFIKQSGFSGSVGYGLTVSQMKGLDVFITEPDAGEAPASYAEPATFVVNPQGVLVAVTRASAPFMRLDMTLLLAGIQYLQDQ